MRPSKPEVEYRPPPLNCVLDEPVEFYRGGLHQVLLI